MKLDTRLTLARACAWALLVSGWVGIEYEGSKLGEDEGIMATKKLLEKIMASVS